MYKTIIYFALATCCHSKIFHSPSSAVKKPSLISHHQFVSRCTKSCVILRGGSTDESSTSDSLSDDAPDSESEIDSISEKDESDKPNSVASKSTGISHFFNRKDSTTKSEISSEPDVALKSKAFPLHSVFHLIKQMAVSALAMNLVKRLDPSKEECVRAARIIYVSYLIVYHGFLAWLRVKICRENDTAEVVIPPPQKLVEMLDKATSNKEENSQESPELVKLKDMAGKVMTRTVTVKSYDLSRIDSMRQQLIATSVFMCFLHLKLGMIKPIILGAALGIWLFTESQIFKIHVLRMKPTGRLARPFSQDTSLNDWMKSKTEEKESSQTNSTSEKSPDELSQTAIDNGDDTSAEHSQHTDGEDESASSDE